VAEIVDDDAINAFAQPGGVVTLTTGLLRFVDSIAGVDRPADSVGRADRASAFLAAVAGHEIVHLALGQVDLGYRALADSLGSLPADWARRLSTPRIAFNAAKAMGAHRAPAGRGGVAFVVANELVALISVGPDFDDAFDGVRPGDGLCSVRALLGPPDDQSPEGWGYRRKSWFLHLLSDGARVVRIVIASEREPQG
jgi:hypothetical protein